MTHYYTYYITVSSTLLYEVVMLLYSVCILCHGCQGCKVQLCSALLCSLFCMKISGGANQALTSMRVAVFVVLVFLYARVCAQTNGKDPTIPVRIRGSKPGEGRVEVFHKGQWGSVCDDRWDYYDALVVCRMLGFSDALQAVSSGRLGSMSESAPIWMDNVHCRGREDSILSCLANPLGKHDCTHKEDAGVKCAVPIPAKVDILPIRIFCPACNSSGNVTGSCKECGGAMQCDERNCSSRVEVEGFPQAFYGGKWRFIDGSRWGRKESFVFCGQLGYPTSFAQPSLDELVGCDNENDSTCCPGDWRDEVNNPIMYGLQCDGHEGAMKNCFFSSWYYARWLNWKAGKYATVRCGYGPGQLCPSAGQVSCCIFAIYVCCTFMTCGNFIMQLYCTSSNKPWLEVPGESDVLLQWLHCIQITLWFIVSWLMTQFQLG